MKATKLFLALAVAVLLGACARTSNVVEFPLVGASNTTSIVFEKIELTDTTTVLTVRGFSRPNTWIRVPSYTHLVAEGKEYKLLDGIDVEIDKELYMPEDGDTCFTLLFEPLPKSTTSFDYIESDTENDWRIYDIDLTGKRDANKPEGLPRELQRIPKTTGEMPKYAYEMGDVTINVHLLGYREGSIKNVVLQVTTAFEGQRRINVNINTKTGKGVVRFRQYGTGCSRVIVDGKGHENFFFAPGEKINLYVNLSRINQSIRYNYKTPIKSPAIKGCWTKGSRYDALNNLPSFDWNGTLTAYDYVENVTDADAYTERLIDYYNDECDYIDNFSCHPWKKVIGKNNTLINCLNALKNDYRRYFESDENDTVGITSVPFESKHYERIYSLVNLDNPWLLLTIGANSIVENTQKLDHSEKRGMLFELSALLNAIPKAYRNQLTNEELQTMRQWSNPFYAAMCEDIINRKREAIATSRKDLTHVEDIAPEALFEAITAPHKGKVILVDFWNTWCRPCRNAIKAVEPYKTGELSSEDLVWVYIANETSPINIYSEMIPGIKGIHYRVNDAQWDYLTSKMFGVTGIPSYVLVDKEGNYSLRNDLRDHAKMVSTLKEELSK